MPVTRFARPVGGFLSGFRQGQQDEESLQRSIRDLRRSDQQFAFNEARNPQLLEAGRLGLLGAERGERVGAGTEQAQIRAPNQAVEATQQGIDFRTETDPLRIRGFENTADMSDLNLAFARFNEQFRRDAAERADTAGFQTSALADARFPFELGRVGQQQRTLSLQDQLAGRTAGAGLENFDLLNNLLRSQAGVRQQAIQGLDPRTLDPVSQFVVGLGGLPQAPRFGTGGGTFNLTDLDDDDKVGDDGRIKQVGEFDNTGAPRDLDALNEAETNFMNLMMDSPAQASAVIERLRSDPQTEHLARQLMESVGPTVLPEGFLDNPFQLRHLLGRVNNIEAQFPRTFRGVQDTPAGILRSPTQEQLPPVLRGGFLG